MFQRITRANPCQSSVRISRNTPDRAPGIRPVGLSVKPRPLTEAVRRLIVIAIATTANLTAGPLGAQTGSGQDKVSPAPPSSSSPRRAG